MSGLRRAVRHPDRTRDPHVRAHALSADRLLEPLDPADEIWLESHLGRCAGCGQFDAAIAADRELFASLRAGVPAPPRDLGARLAGALDAEVAAAMRAGRRVAAHPVHGPARHGEPRHDFERRQFAEERIRAARAREEATARRRGGVAAVTASRPSFAFVGTAAAALLALLVVPVLTAPSGSQFAGVPVPTAGVAGLASPGPTPMRVATDQVAVLQRDADGSYRLATTHVSAVCPGTTIEACGTIETAATTIALIDVKDPRALLFNQSAGLAVVVDRTAIYAVDMPGVAVSTAPDPGASQQPVASPAGTGVPASPPVGTPAPSAGSDPTPAATAIVAAGTDDPERTPGPSSRIATATASPAHPATAAPSEPAASPATATPDPSAGATTAPSADPSATPAPTASGSPGGTAPAESPAATEGVATPEPSPAPTADPDTTQEPTVAPAATPEVTIPPATPAPTAARTLAIVENVVVMGAPPAYSPDGNWMAFSARPADGDGGPDVYAWRVGSRRAVELTKDGASQFAGWFGNRIVVSRTVVDGKPAGADADPAAVVAVSRLVDPASGSGRDLAGSAWLPVIDPTQQFVAYWRGSFAWSAREHAWMPQRGRLVISTWPSLRDATGEPVANVPWTGRIADSSEWTARWDPSGRLLAVWIADGEDADTGRLSLFRVDENGKLSTTPVKESIALSSISLTSARLAWATPSGKGGEGSRLAVYAWNENGDGQVESNPDPDGSIVVGQ